MSVKKYSSNQWQKWGWFCLLLLIATYLCASMFKGWGAFYWGPLESDLTNQFFPWRVFIHRWVMRGIMPFWDPHAFSGYPTIESQQMLALNPVHLLTLWMTPNIGLALAMGFHTMIALIGMYWGLLWWGRSTPLAAAAGSAVFVFGALFAVRITAGHFTVVAAIAWWPLAVLSVLRMSRLVPAMIPDRSGADKKPWRYLIALILASLKSGKMRRLIALSAVFHAMVCLAGGPQYIVYLFYIDVITIAAVARKRALFASLAMCALAWIVALLLSAPQWLSAFWYLPYTGRALSSSGATGWSTQPLLNIGYETLLPFPFGDDLIRAHLHFKNVWETALYPGVFALAVTLGTMIRSTVWVCRRFAGRTTVRISPMLPLGLAGISILLIGFYMMLGGWLPGFGGFREPTKARAILAFAMALITASGLTQLSRRRVGHIFSILGGAVCIFALTLCAYLLIQKADFVHLITSFGAPFDPLAFGDYNAFLKDPTAAYTIFRSAALKVVVISGVCVPLTFILAGWPRTGKLCLTALALITILDPFSTHSGAWLARYPWSRIELPDSIAQFFKPRLNALKTNHELPWRVVIPPGIINRTHLMEGLYEFYGYDPLMPAFAVGRMLVKDSAKAQDDNTTRVRIRRMERAGLRFDLTHGDYYGNGVINDIIEAPDAALFSVNHKVVAGSPGSNMFGPDMDGVSYVLPANLGGKVSEPPVVPEDFKSRISSVFNSAAEAGLMAGETIAPIDTGKPDEYGVTVDLKSPGLIVYKGTWLPGWRVIVDGHEKGRALFANNWMCGAIVDAGRHQVMFKYRPVGWLWAWALSFSGFVILCGLYLSLKKRKQLRDLKEIM